MCPFISFFFKAYDIRSVFCKTFDIGIDGLQVEYADGFGLVHSSNMTPVVVMRFDGELAEVLSRIRQDSKRAIHASKPDTALPF